jgi:hypothetical protein
MKLNIFGLTFSIEKVRKPEPAEPLGYRVGKWAEDAAASEVPYLNLGQLGAVERSRSLSAEYAAAMMNSAAQMSSGLIRPRRGFFGLGL